MARTHRKRLEKVVYSDAFVCVRCGVRVGCLYAILRDAKIQFECLFSRYSRCLRCGKTEQVSRLEKRDYIDRFAKHPLSWVQRVMGAPISRCSACRLQYYDWRRPGPEAKSQ